ncbi:cytochrome C oxidase assembly protein [Couchioplanes caeruleus subsp. caeruleus]|uniref:Cytochrome C oxidase assembly protein n=1 Tax=Couchioplanes caeruleus subsp. caeruleus TaxID=56427 RepID=A0A1K0FBH0_9ACTN|nr:cytochrome C oxidase assembly protein [Couchioplanes caeruleus subsp. caeruleus]
MAPAALPALLAVGYVLAVRRDGRGWPRHRTAAFLTGAALLAVALLPPVSGYAERSFHGHMVQHLLLAMLGPLCLALGAPVTLLLRALPVRRARQITRLLRGRPARLVTHPLVVLLLNVGALPALYLTPLYTATTTSPPLHHAVHAHFVAAGYLFAWVIAGPDPAPHRPSVPARLVMLGVAIAVHATLAQLIYAGVAVHLDVPADDRRAGADLMYYGGDIAELLLALAMLTSAFGRTVRSV